MTQRCANSAGGGGRMKILAQQHAQPDEVRLVGIGVSGDHRVVVAQRRVEVGGRQRAHLDRRQDAVPQRAPGPVAAMHQHARRPVHRDAGGQAQIVQEVKRLPLRLEPENEMVLVRYHFRVTWRDAPETNHASLSII
jgi:hypothetical protein